MKAMIFAAGLGTRLKPITDNIPKALVEIDGVPMLELVIKRLIRYGFNEIIINVHYFAEKVIAFLKEKNNFNIQIEISNETDLLLDTGGGLKKAGWFFNDGQPFLLHNVDILSSLDLGKIYQHHVLTDALATLSVQDRESSRKLRFTKEEVLCAWINKKTGEEKIARKENYHFEFAFNGIHIINPKIFSLIKENGVFSIIDLYLRLASKYDINFFYDKNARFLDIGTPAQLAKAIDF